MLPTPPLTASSGSSRRRRTQASSEEEDPTGKFGVSCVKYRVGAPPLRPLPLRSIMDDNCRNITRLLGNEITDHATDVLLRHGITDPEDAPGFMPLFETEGPHGNPNLVYEVDIVSRVIEEAPETAQPTLLIITKWTPDAPSTWEAIVKELKKYINNLISSVNELKDLDIAVEMIAPELAMRKYISPIPIDSDFDGLSLDWPAIRTGVVQILDDFSATANFVTAVSLFSLGYRWEGNPKTVYISVDYESSQNSWPPVLHRLQEFVDGYNYKLQVHMEHNTMSRFVFDLVPAEGASQSEEFREEYNLVHYSKYQTKVNMGADIGAYRYLTRNDGKICNPGVGTLGCYIEIKTKNSPNWTTLALTNYHVVRSCVIGFRLIADPEILPESGRRPSSQVGVPIPESDLWETDENGFYPKTVKKRKLVEHPARTKHNHTLDAFSEAVPGTMKPEIIQQQTQFFDLDKQLFAEVWFGSGFVRRTPNNGRLDWALLKPLNQERIGKNQLPGRDEWLPGCGAKYIPSNTFDKTLQEPSGSSLANLRQGSAIYKMGASTRNTGGLFNGFKTDCRLSDDSHVFSNRKQRMSTEYTYIGTGFSQVFAAGGDSGSVVFDGEGRALGLLFSGQKPQQLGSGVKYALVTPIEDVFADIKALSKGEITHIRIVGTN